MIRSAHVRWLLYAPTLKSPGGVTAVLAQLEDSGVTLDAAIVSRTAATALSSLLQGLAEVETVSGHADGVLKLRRLRATAGPFHVFCVQNPVIPASRFERTLLQNYLPVNPRRALEADHSVRMCYYVAVTTIMTWLQVMVSSRVIVLNSAYPRIWDLFADVQVVRNRLPWAAPRIKVGEDRERTFLLVTSWERFRGAHMIIKAFGMSGLASQGWHLRIMARRSSTQYEQECSKIAAGTPGVTLLHDMSAEEVHAALATSSFALFPSAVEGGSIAFLEALQSGCTAIALDRCHYTEAYDNAERSAAVRWVAKWTPQAWSEALSAAAETVDCGERL